MKGTVDCRVPLTFLGDSIGRCEQRPRNRGQTWPLRAHCRLSQFPQAYRRQPWWITVLLVQCQIQYWPNKMAPIQIKVTDWSDCDLILKWSEVWSELEILCFCFCRRARMICSSLNKIWRKKRWISENLSAGSYHVWNWSCSYLSDTLPPNSFSKLFSSAAYSSPVSGANESDSWLGPGGVWRPFEFVLSPLLFRLFAILGGTG